MSARKDIIFPSYMLIDTLMYSAENDGFVDDWDKLSPALTLAGTGIDDGANYTLPARDDTLKRFRVSVASIQAGSGPTAEKMLELDTANLYFGVNGGSGSVVPIGGAPSSTAGTRANGLPVKLQKVHFFGSRFPTAFKDGPIVNASATSIDDDPAEYACYMLCSSPVKVNRAPHPDTGAEDCSTEGQEQTQPVVDWIPEGYFSNRLTIGGAPLTEVEIITGVERVASAGAGAIVFKKAKVWVAFPKDHTDTTWNTQEINYLDGGDCISTTVGVLTNGLAPAKGNGMGCFQDKDDKITGDIGNLTGIIDDLRSGLTDITDNSPQINVITGVDRESSSSTGKIIFKMGRVRVLEQEGISPVEWATTNIEYLDTTLCKSSTVNVLTAGDVPMAGEDMHCLEAKFDDIGGKFDTIDDKLSCLCDQARGLWSGIDAIITRLVEITPPEEELPPVQVPPLLGCMASICLGEGGGGGTPECEAAALALTNDKWYCISPDGVVFANDLKAAWGTYCPFTVEGGPYNTLEEANYACECIINPPAAPDPAYGDWDRVKIWRQIPAEYEWRLGSDMNINYADYCPYEPFDVNTMPTVDTSKWYCLHYQDSSLTDHYEVLIGSDIVSLWNGGIPFTAFIWGLVGPAYDTEAEALANPCP